jgi:CBS domain-containing protein
MQFANVITSPTIFVAPIRRPKVSTIVHRPTITRYSNDRAEAVLSGEWETNWGLATYDDIQTYFTNNMIKKSHKPSTRISDIMQRNVVAANPDDKISDLRAAFEKFTGLPVVRPSDHGLVGVISRKDLHKAGTLVSDIMSHPPVAAKATDTVSAAACIMLKYKVHRLPIVDNSDRKKCIGMVTRSDIFTALTVDDHNTNRERLNMDR